MSDQPLLDKLKEIAESGNRARRVASICARRDVAYYTNQSYADACDDALTKIAEGITELRKTYCDGAESCKACEPPDGRCGFYGAIPAEQELSELLKEGK